MPGIGTIIGLLGGWRAAGFAIGMIAMGAILAWQNAVTIPGLRVDLAETREALARSEAELSKAVTAANHNAAELKRVTEDAATAKARADKARRDAEARARVSDAQLEALRKELTDAKAEDDGPVAPALARVINGLRRAP